MKTILKLLIIAALAIVEAWWPLAISAQQYSSAGSFGTAVAASTTSNYTSSAVFTATKYEDVAIWIKSVVADAGTDNTVVNFQRSLDGTTYETTPGIIVTIANTGTTAVNTITNINVGACGYIRLSSVVNGDGSGILTVTNKFYIKPQRFGK